MFLSDRPFVDLEAVNLMILILLQGFQESKRQNYNNPEVGTLGHILVTVSKSSLFGSSFVFFLDFGHRVEEKFDWRTYL